MPPARMLVPTKRLMQKFRGLTSKSQAANANSRDSSSDDGEALWLEYVVNVEPFVPWSK